MACVLAHSVAASSAIEDSNFSAATKAKVRHWHERAAALLNSLDLALGQTKSGTAAAMERVDRLLAAARVDIEVLRLTLEEIHAELAEPPVQAPKAAAEAVKALTTGDIATLRTLHANPPQTVRDVLICTCTLLACGTSPPPREMLQWEDAQSRLASSDFKRSLLGARACRNPVNRRIDSQATMRTRRHRRPLRSCST